MKSLYEGKFFDFENLNFPLSKSIFCVLTRIHYVKNITKRKEKDILLLKSKLDEYNDGWRTADTTDNANNYPSLIRAAVQNKTKKGTTRKYKRNSDVSSNSKNDNSGTTNGSAKDATSKNVESKRKRQKVVR